MYVAAREGQEEERLVPIDSSPGPVRHPAYPSDRDAIVAARSSATRRPYHRRAHHTSCIMLYSTLPFGTRLVAVSILSLLLIIPKFVVSFQLSSLPSIATAAAAAAAPSAAHGRHPSLLSASNENIEVEDFEEYARCLSPREVSYWL